MGNACSLSYITKLVALVQPITGDIVKASDRTRILNNEAV
jgi:hypothetical protein